MSAAPAIRHDYKFSVGRDPHYSRRFEFVIYGKRERDGLAARVGGFKSWKAAFAAACRWEPGQ